MNRNITPFGLRLPPELKGQLEFEAHKNGRSLNAEIVHRLINRDKQLTLKAIEDRLSKLDAIEKKLGELLIKHRQKKTLTTNLKDVKHGYFKY